ncbi:transcription elongation factor [Martiniozyma asiatica (nom. inval.)]|nr:transcription elongation factor [Martiniozyma asiatica]
MDATEAKDIVAQLSKSPSPDTVIELLTRLNTQVQATEKFLRETKIGVAVNKFKTDSNAEIVKLVKGIIKKWKEQVSKEKKSAAVVKKAKAEFKTTQTRNPKNDGVSCELTDNSTRNATISGLYTALAFESTDLPAEVLNVAAAVEKAVFNLYHNKVENEYRTKVRSLIMNLKNKKNPELRFNLLSGSIKAEKFIKMTSAEMAPETLKKEMKELHEKNLFDAQGAVQKRAVTDRFTCGKCKQKEVSYYQMQTRSADEPLTTFCTCEKCGNRWKFC